MATATLTKPAAKGGSFLLESPQPGDVFTPADLSDDQRLIGQTAEDFVLKEVFPPINPTSPPFFTSDAINPAFLFSRSLMSGKTSLRTNSSAVCPISL